MKKYLLYLATLIPLIIVACNDDDNISDNIIDDTELSYTPFVMNKGVNISNWLANYGYGSDPNVAKYFTEDEVRQLAAYGFDHIRLPIGEDMMFTEDGYKNESNFNILHNVIKWCIDRKSVV